MGVVKKNGAFFLNITIFSDWVLILSKIRAELHCLYNPQLLHPRLVKTTNIIIMLNNVKYSHKKFDSKCLNESYMSVY